MTYLTHVPGPPLSRFIDLLWLFDGRSQGNRKERVLPSGEMQIIVTLREESLRMYDRDNADRYETIRGSLLSGAQSEYTIIDAPLRNSLMGVHFRPGGAYPFFPLPAGELQNTAVPLDALWGAQAETLRSRLLEARTPLEKFATLEQTLLKHLMQPAELHSAVAFALREFGANPGSSTVSSVTERLGLSANRFIEVFRDQIGLTPKVFCRIKRFQLALARIRAQEKVNWPAVALDCGYFDQAHFIHDFRAFSGINPSTYIAHRTPHMNHVSLPD